MVKKNRQRLVVKKMFTPKTNFFLYKGKQNIYIQNIGHIWGYIHAGIFEKVLIYLIRPNV